MATFVFQESQKNLFISALFLNIFAIFYTLFSYSIGILFIAQEGIFLNTLGLFFLTHSLIYSAYLSHEFMHGNIFKSFLWNKRFGQIMLWLNGGCYFGFQTLMHQHIAHHVKRVDVFTFDIPNAIQKLPHSLRLIIVALEWCYFPIVSFWSRWRSVIYVWQTSQSLTTKIKILGNLIIRICLFILLGLFSVKALLLYFLAYIGMISVLRFMDAFQHTYEAFPPNTVLPKKDSNYEQANTFSNLISFRYPWLNLLCLNFGYHNAHHSNMKCPWYKLQELDQTLSLQNSQPQYIPILKQIANYHTFRVTRLFQGQGEVVQVNNKVSFDQFYGAVDVSFLTVY